MSGITFFIVIVFLCCKIELVPIYFSQINSINKKSKFIIFLFKYCRKTNLMRKILGVSVCVILLEVVHKKLGN